jgi:hypothetical protein
VQIIINRNPISPSRLDRFGATVYMAFTALAIFTLPSSLWGISAGLDSSWVVGLHLAAANGLVYGRDVLFSYGPLGFLMFPLLINARLWTFAVIVRDLIHMALFISLAAFVSHTENRLVNAIMLGVSAPFIETFLGTVYTLGVVIMVTAYLVVCNRKRSYLALLGVMAALGFYTKADIGLLSLVIILVATTWSCLKQACWKSLTLLAVYAASLIVSGLIIAQSPGSLLSFILGYVQLSAGYANAMSVDRMPFWFVLFPLAALFIIIVLLIARSSLQTRLLFGLAIPFLFITYKEGFVREDLGHMFIFLAAWASFCFLFQAVITYRSGRLAKIVAVCLALIILGSGIEAWGMTYAEKTLSPTGLGANISEFAEMVYAPSRFRSVLQDIELAVSYNKAQAVFNQTLATTRLAYHLSETTAAVLRGHTVDVLPWDVSLAYAYDLKWDPAPVFQSYSAYTPYLDEVNALHYMKQGSPDFVLYSYQNLDGRYPLFDEPLALVALMCNYKLVGYDTQFLILQRRTGSTCGGSRLISVQDVTFGHPIQVPSSEGTPVIARVFIQASWLGVISELAYKIPNVTIGMKNSNRESENYRLVVATARDGLILREGFLSTSIPAVSIEQMVFSTSGPEYYNPEVRVEFYEILPASGSNLTNSQNAVMQCKILSDDKTKVSVQSMTSTGQMGIWQVFQRRVNFDQWSHVDSSLAGSQSMLD